MEIPVLPAAFAAEGHDHERCVSAALARAADLCRRRGVRLTPQRRQVLAIVWEQHKPVGAYEILETLQIRGTRAAPPTVYRALDFLLQQGLIHRIESLNAFTGCTRPGRHHCGQFLVCSECGAIAELADETLTRSVRERADELGFEARHQTIEVSGICPRCREPGDG